MQVTTVVLMLAAIIFKSFVAILVIHAKSKKPFVHQPTLDSQIDGSLEALLAARERTVAEADYDSSFDNEMCAPKMCEPLKGALFPPPLGYNNKELKTLKKQLVWECKRSLCNPLCLHTAWGTEFKVESCKDSDSDKGSDGKPAKFCEKFRIQVERRSTQIALAAQIQAHACDTILSCCKNPMNEQSADKLHWLPRWVEER